MAVSDRYSIMGSLMADIMTSPFVDECDNAIIEGPGVDSSLIEAMASGLYTTNRLDITLL